MFIRAKSNSGRLRTRFGTEMKPILILVSLRNVFVKGSPQFCHNHYKRPGGDGYGGGIEGRFFCHISFGLLMQTTKGQILFLRGKNVSGNKIAGRLVLHNSGTSNK
jgi:hypothetical protein